MLSDPVRRNVGGRNHQERLSFAFRRERCCRERTSAHIVSVSPFGFDFSHLSEQSIQLCLSTFVSLSHYTMPQCVRILYAPCLFLTLVWLRKTSVYILHTNDNYTIDSITIKGRAFIDQRVSRCFLNLPNLMHGRLDLNLKPPVRREPTPSCLPFSSWLPRNQH
jgi:hypothetical protein